MVGGEMVEFNIRYIIGRKKTPPYQPPTLLVLSTHSRIEVVNLF